MKNMIKSYSELISLKTFEERFEYLKLSGKVGIETFGFDRIFNQMFYTSSEWKRVRREVIIRDNGCDLGIEDREIYKQRIIVHHINPISLDDINDHSSLLLNPDNLISTCHNTHLAIHYSDNSILNKGPVERYLNDTCPWKLNQRS